MVLGTDMKQHCHIISRFQTVLQVKLHSRMMTTGASASPASGGANAPEIKFEDPADRSMLLQVCPANHFIYINILMITITTKMHASQG